MAAVSVKKTAASFPAVDLLGYAITDVTFKSNIEGVEELSTVYKREDIDRKTAISCNSDSPEIWRVDLTLALKRKAWKCYAYNWSVSLIGVFKCNMPTADYPDDERERMVSQSALSILYTTAREYLRALSAPGIKGAFLLPTVSFIEAKKSFSKEKTTKKVSSTQ